MDPASNEQPRKRVKIDSIHPGPLRHANLPKPLLRRIEAVYTRLKDVQATNLEAFEIAMMRDADVENEVALWERIADAVEKITGTSRDFDRKMVFRTLLVYSADALTEKQLADPVVKRIIEMVEGE